MVLGGAWGCSLCWLALAGGSRFITSIDLYVILYYVQYDEYQVLVPGTTVLSTGTGTSVLLHDRAIKLLNPVRYRIY